ncbi:MAG: hypothetical protein V4598_18280 [Bdellovibrionota bacterium]
MKFLTTTILLFSFEAMAAMKNEITVQSVSNSKWNQIAANVPKSVTCEKFKGTYHGNAIVLAPKVTDGSGRYEHRLVWQMSESYKTFDLTRQQNEVTVKNGTYRFEIPELKDDVPFLQQSVFLITRDLRTGETATSQLLFNVTRPVVLANTDEPSKLAMNCFQVFPANESVAGILTNSSSNPSQITIRQGIQSIWSRTNGAQWGFYLSPLAWTGLGNVFSIYRSYFTQFSRQTIETVEVASGYQIAPGDFVQLYEQRTRYVSAFDAYEISACGESKEVEGPYFMQWWGVAYHAAPINPYATEKPPRETIGVAPVNNCPDELTPDFARENNDYIFTRTN